MSLLKVVGLILSLGVIFVIARLGSVGFALSSAGLIALFGVFIYLTRKRPGRRYEKKAPTRADADISTWWNSG